MLINQTNKITAIDSDGKLEPIDKLLAHQKGVHHLAISIFIFSGDSMLIQQRAQGKYHSAGLWANACCSHPSWGELPEDCAARRVKEELGVSLPMKHMGVIDYTADVGDDLTESERVFMFVGEADANAFPLNPDPEEVSATRWIDTKELEVELANEPDRFSAWFQQYMSRHDTALLAVRAYGEKTVNKVDSHVLSEALAYQDIILQGVSRTFAATIPLLPNELVSIVGNAYLLCRVADTIEDDARLSLEEKQYFSQKLIQVLNNTVNVQGYITELLPRLAEQTATEEKDLVQNLDKVLLITRNFSQNQQQIIFQYVTTMLKGMVRFQSMVSNTGLPTQKDLDSYCYYVAGVVGEMLTDLFCDYRPSMAPKRERMRQLSVSFGQGLQMTNILKDIHNDQQRGACWLPKDLFDSLNINLAQSISERSPDDFAKGLEHLIAITHAHLCNSLEYTLNLPKHDKKLRTFCMATISMSLLTLNKLHKNPNFSDSNQIKISRRSVKIALLLSNYMAGSDALLKITFALLSKGLPKPVY